MGPFRRDLPENRPASVFGGKVTLHAGPARPCRVLKVLRIERVSKSAFSGPLPHPDNFEKHGRILPGAAERILSAAEKNLRIRTDRQKGAIADERMKIAGAAWVGTLLIVAAGLTGWTGSSVSACRSASREQSIRSCAG